MSKVIVGLSGGVDSAVTALLLKRAGYEVTGLYLRTRQEESSAGEEDAARTARALGIAFAARDCSAPFRRQVVEPFIEEYLRGRTPNPCTLCNRRVKWEQMLQAAREIGAEHIATGHYARAVRLPNGRYAVRRALEREKDQSYMLYRLSQEQLAAALLPLGEYAKPKVRAIAREAGIPVADKPDSQEICFIPEGDHAAFIAQNAGDRLPPEGNFVDGEGRVLGRHRGVYRYTVGQRKGLGLALGSPAYVREIRPEQNEVVLGPGESLLAREVLCGDLVFQALEPPATGERIACEAMIRYRHRAQPALLEIAGEGEARLLFAEPVRAAAPGQSAVFYDGEGRIIGGGIIQ